MYTYITCIAPVALCGTLESPDSIQTGSCTGPNLSLLPRFEQQSSAKDQPDWKVRDRTFHPPRVFQVWDKKMSMPDTFTDLPHKAPRFSWQKPQVFTSFRLSVAGWHKDHKGIGNRSSFNVLIALYAKSWPICFTCLWGLRGVTYRRAASDMSRGDLSHSPPPPLRDFLPSITFDVHSPCSNRWKRILSHSQKIKIHQVAARFRFHQQTYGINIYIYIHIYIL